MSIDPFCRAIRYTGDKSVYALSAPVGKSTAQIA